jgi:NADPH:quinone reductase-like Zn-dependent oxidoreductase
MGVIEHVGEDVLQWEIGQRVVPLQTNGTWQEYVLADAQTLIAVPDGIDDHAAAMVLANPTSAWLLLHNELKVPQNEWLLQNAANSAVGRFVIQLSKRAGIKTINVVRRRDVIDELHALGADEVLCEADEDVVTRVKDITGGKGVRYAIDSVAGRSGGQLIQALAPGGTAIIFGAISNKPLVIDPGALLFKGNTVRGWWLARWFRTASPEQISLLFAELIPLVADGTLHVPVAAAYDLADVKQAVAAAEGSERNGKIVLEG